jgi:SAM-dependent MidA family methyltransferase
MTQPLQGSAKMRGMEYPLAEQHRQVVQKIAVGQKMDRLFRVLAQVNGTQAGLHIR